MNIIEYKSQKGITLIALVVTIIIVLIIAGISINAAFDKKGAIREANDRVINGQKESLIEKIEADLYTYKTIYGTIPDADRLIKIIKKIDNSLEVTGTDNPIIIKKDEDGNEEYRIDCTEDIIGWEGNY